MLVIWIIVAILIFSIIVLIHELGHFWSAKFFKVKVEEFGLWLPPRAKTIYTDKSGTKYSINYLPLWWFVRLSWESSVNFLLYDENKVLLNNEELEKYIKKWKDIYDKNWEIIKSWEKDEILKRLQLNNADYNLNKKSVFAQSIIMLAWAFMNFLFAFVIFFFLFLFWVKPIWINDKIEIQSELKLIPNFSQALESWVLNKNPWIVINPVENSKAREVWLIAWDILLELHFCKNSSIVNIYTCSWIENVKKITLNNPTDLTSVIQENKDKKVIFLAQRQEEKKFYLMKIPEDWKIWVYIWENISVNKDFIYKYWPILSAKYAFLETKNQIILTFKSLSFLVDKIFTPENKEERQEAIKAVSWPIWIVDFISSSLKAWIIFMIVFSAIISINLWVFNLLPIPALDWWRFVIININNIIKKIFGKKIISENSESIAHLVFFIVLIALSVIIAYNDINKILSN